MEKLAIGLVDKKEPEHMLNLIVKHAKDNYPAVRIHWNSRSLKVGDYYFEDETRIIIVERKKVADLLSSIHDNRVFEQITKLQHFNHDMKKVIRILIIVGEWKHASYHSKMHRYSIFYSFNGIIKDSLAHDVIPITVPNDNAMADLCLKILEDKEWNYIKGRGILKNANKADRFALSIMALVKGFGQKKAKIISKYCNCYSDINQYTPLELSNLIRRETGTKEQKKPFKTVLELYEFI